MLHRVAQHLRAWAEYGLIEASTAPSKGLTREVQGAGCAVFVAGVQRLPGLGGRGPLDRREAAGRHPAAADFDSARCVATDWCDCFHDVRASCTVPPPINHRTPWPQRAASLARSTPEQGPRAIRCTAHLHHMHHLLFAAGRGACRVRSAGASVEIGRLQRVPGNAAKSCAARSAGCGANGMCLAPKQLPSQDPALLNTALTCQPLSTVAWREDGLLIVEGGVQPLHLTQRHHCTGPHSKSRHFT